MAKIIFIETTFSYRGWRPAVAAVALTVFGVACLGELFYALIYKNTPNGSEWMIALFVLSLGGLFSVLAGTIWWKMIRNQGELARIDSEGVTQGKYFLAWDRVRFIAASRSGWSGWMLKIAVRRRPDRTFWIGRPFTWEEYEALRDRLDPFLEEHFPDVGLEP